MDQVHEVVHGPGVRVLSFPGVRLTWQVLARNLCKMLVNLLMATASEGLY